MRLAANIASVPSQGVVTHPVARAGDTPRTGNWGRNMPRDECTPPGTTPYRWFDFPSRIAVVVQEPKKADESPIDRAFSCTIRGRPQPRFCDEPALGARIGRLVRSDVGHLSEDMKAAMLPICIRCKIMTRRR